MKRLLTFLVLAFTGLAAQAGSKPEVYSTNFWEVEGKTGYVTWVEIYNSPEARTNGIAHVSVVRQKQDDPVWKLEWVCPHIAITTDALKRSVIRPLKAKGAYPEHFYEALNRWKEDKRKGTAVIYSTSVQDFLNHQP